MGQIRLDCYPNENYPYASGLDGRAFWLGFVSQNPAQLQAYDSNLALAQKDVILTHNAVELFLESLQGKLPQMSLVVLGFMSNLDLPQELQHSHPTIQYILSQVAVEPKELTIEDALSGARLLLEILQDSSLTIIRTDLPETLESITRYIDTLTNRLKTTASHKFIINEKV